MEDWEHKYKELVKYVAQRDFLTSKVIEEALISTHPDIIHHRRFQSEHLHEKVSLLLDVLLDKHTINITLENELTFEKGACKLWKEACEELAKENEE